MAPLELEEVQHQQDALHWVGDREEVHGAAVGAAQLAEQVVARGVEDAVLEAWVQGVEHSAWEVVKEVPLALGVVLDQDVVAALLA